MTTWIAALPRASHAITIDMDYSDEGDPIPHDENPSWDPDGTILKAHFAAAKAIWEALLPGEEDYSFDFHWDDDIAGLGKATDGPTDTFIEIQPNANWFADPTPNNNDEFSTSPTQKLFGQLSSADRTTYFPGPAPPDALESLYNLRGNVGVPGVGGFDARNGTDLLTVVMHEMGHILGIGSDPLGEPGEFNIHPQHIGGIENVRVLEDAEDGHLAGNATTPGFLMCDACELTGWRRLPTATDVLVIAEDQGIDDVLLARVGRISAGAWSNASAWIGADVPGASQDVYITSGSFVTLDVDAEVKNLRVDGGIDLTVGDHELLAGGTLDFAGGDISVAASGRIDADKIVGDTDRLTTAAGSLVRFNSFKRGASSTVTSATFNGSIAIGKNTGSNNAVTFDPNPIQVWTIDQDLTIGDENDVSVVIRDVNLPGPPPTTNEAVWNVAGNVTVGGVRGKLTIQNGAQMTIGGNLTVQGSEGLTSEVTVEGNAALSVGGTVRLRPYSQMFYRLENVANETYLLEGGNTTVIAPIPPSTAYTFKRDTAPVLTFSDGGDLDQQGVVSSVSITADGGRGNESPASQVIFSGNMIVRNSNLVTIGGHRGPDAPLGVEIAGFGGRITFADDSYTENNGGPVTISNDGSDYRGGTGGITTFEGRSDAHDAVIFNHGGTFSNGSIGGSTQFNGSSATEFAEASNATITNYGSVSLGGSGNATFLGHSHAARAVIFNEAATPSQFAGGFTAFRGNSVAGDAPLPGGEHSSRIFNKGTPAGSNYPGLTVFYDFAKAGLATIRNNPGSNFGGRTEFRGNSSADQAKLIIETRLPFTRGGSINFYDNASGGNAKITAETNTFSDGINFNGSSTAGDADIFLVDDSSTFVRFFGQSRGGTAHVDVGRINQLQFYESSNAENIDVTVFPRGVVTSTGSFNVGNNPTTTLGHATIHLLGSNTDGQGNFAGSLGVNSLATAGDATITADGGTVGGFQGGAPGAIVSIDHFGHAGNATIELKTGTNGGRGAELYFQRGGNGDNARIVTQPDTHVFIRNFGYIDTTAGSIEGGGRFHIMGGGLFVVGSRNDSTVLTGPIVNDGLSTMGEGGALTKVGTGTLTLAGANTYTGDTNVDAGTLVVNGSMASEIIVKGGAALMGSGSITGDVTINSGATLSPGTSPGILTLHNLSLAGGSTLDFELGDPLRDRIVITVGGNVALAGTLNISLLDGFTPSLGQSFSLFEGAIGSITGAFSSVIAPTVNGLTFDLVQNASSVMLQAATAPFLAGDYNGNGAVDAADYVVWRNNLGSGASLLNDDTPGVGQDDYNRWKSNFGQTGGAGNTAAYVTSVAEPSAILSASILIVFLLIGPTPFLRGS